MINLQFDNRSFGLMRVSGVVQHFSCPLIDAFAAGLGGGGYCGVDLYRDSQHQVAGIRFVRRLSQLFTGGQVIINRLVKSRLQFIHRGAVKIYSVTDADHATDKNTILGIKLNGADIAFVLFHVFMVSLPVFQDTPLLLLFGIVKLHCPGGGDGNILFYHLFQTSHSNRLPQSPGSLKQ